MVKSFEEFLNEDLNFTISDTGDCRLSTKWFYYNPDDDIIYGSDERPVGDGALFSFNPVSCIFIMNGEEKNYDVNDPVLLVKYDMKRDEVVVYTTNTLEYLKSIGFFGNDLNSRKTGIELNDIFEEYDDIKHLLLYGDKMIASTFDVIEEN